MVTQQLVSYLTNGGLLKTLSIIILFLFTLGSGGIIAYELLSNEPVNPIIATYLSIVLTSIVHMLNLTQTSGIIASALLINPPISDAQGGKQP